MSLAYCKVCATVTSGARCEASERRPTCRNCPEVLQARPVAFLRRITVKALWEFQPASIKSFSSGRVSFWNKSWYSSKQRCSLSCTHREGKNHLHANSSHLSWRNIRVRFIRKFLLLFVLTRLTERSRGVGHPVCDPLHDLALKHSQSITRVRHTHTHTHDCHWFFHFGSTNQFLQIPLGTNADLILRCTREHQMRCAGVASQPKITVVYTRRPERSAVQG